MWAQPTSQNLQIEKRYCACAVLEKKKGKDRFSLFWKLNARTLQTAVARGREMKVLLLARNSRHYVYAIFTIAVALSTLGVVNAGLGGEPPLVFSNLVYTSI